MEFAGILLPFFAEMEFTLMPDYPACNVVVALVIRNVPERASSLDLSAMILQIDPISSSPTGT